MSQPTDTSTLWTWVGGVITVLGALYLVFKTIFSYVTRTELVRITADQDAKFLKAQEDMEKRWATALEAQRQERLRIADEQHTEMIRLHNENRDTSGQVFDRVAAVERSVSRIEGAISGTYKTLDPHGR